MEHAAEKVKEKFPFDAMGDWEDLSSSNTACPKYKFWGYEKEYCFIRDAFGLLKYPAWLSFLIWSILSL